MSKNEIEKLNDRIESVIIGIAGIITPLVMTAYNINNPIPQDWFWVVLVVVRIWAARRVYYIMIDLGRDKSIGYLALIVPFIMLVIAGCLKKKKYTSENIKG